MLRNVTQELGRILWNNLKESVKVKSNLSLPRTRRHRGEADTQLNPFLNWALAGGRWVISRPGHFNTGKEQTYPMNRSWAGWYPKPDSAF